MDEGLVQAIRIVCLQKSFCVSKVLSQIITAPTVFRMFDVFRLTMLFCSDSTVTQKHALERIDRWAPGVAERYCAIWNKKSSLCSYGEKRWFFTLSLLSADADFVILDEPTAGVDPEFRHYIWKCLEGAAAELCTSPPSTFLKPQTTSKKVVFPEPLGPSKPEIDPASTLNEALLNSTWCENLTSIESTISRFINNDSKLG